jgi:hypothetical protein
MYSEPDYNVNLKGDLENRGITPAYRPLEQRVGEDEGEVSNRQTKKHRD